MSINKNQEHSFRKTLSMNGSKPTNEPPAGFQIKGGSSGRWALRERKLCDLTDRGVIPHVRIASVRYPCDPSQLAGDAGSAACLPPVRTPVNRVRRSQQSRRSDGGLNRLKTTHDLADDEIMASIVTDKNGRKASTHRLAAPAARFGYKVTVKQAEVVKIKVETPVGDRQGRPRRRGLNGG